MKDEIQVEKNEAQRIIKRHMARCLTNLEEANCSAIIVKAVKRAFNRLYTFVSTSFENNEDEGAGKQYKEGFNECRDSILILMRAGGANALFIDEVDSAWEWLNNDLTTDPAVTDSRGNR